MVMISKDKSAFLIKTISPTAKVDPVALAFVVLTPEVAADIVAEVAATISVVKE